MQIDEFIVEAVDLSKLNSIRIGHNGNNSGDGWFLEKVIIQDPQTKANYTFLCNRSGCVKYSKEFTVTFYLNLIKQLNFI